MQYAAYIQRVAQVAGNAGCSDWNPTDRSPFEAADLDQFTVDNQAVIIPTSVRRLAL